MADLQTLNTRLTEAEDALHQLALGKTKVEIQINGRKVVYTPANSKNLEGYISKLKNQINPRRALSFNIR
jgi:hypothetical protein